jgi:hypothetical protein
MIILPAHYRSRQWSRVRGPRRQFTLGGVGCKCCATGPPVITCGTCGIPQQNLTLSWAASFCNQGTSGTNTLIWNGNTNPNDAQWSAVPALGASAPTEALLLCSGGAIQLQISLQPIVGGGLVCTGFTTSASGTACLAVSSFTCSPFSIQWNIVDTGGGPCTCEPLAEGACIYTTIGITA